MKANNREPIPEGSAAEPCLMRVPRPHRYLREPCRLKFRHEGECVNELDRGVAELVAAAEFVLGCDDVGAGGAARLAAAIEKVRAR